MSESAVLGNRRTIIVCALVAFGIWFAFAEQRIDLWSALLPLFEWLETTPFGYIGKTWGAAFAAVEAVHLLAMAVLGGSVLVSDGRLLGLFFRDAPLADVQAQCHRLFVWSLLLSIFTGVFMACGVATKIYYLEVFWYKMLALAIGVAFVFGVKRPLLQAGEDDVPVGLLRLVAIASLMIWFSVAATGRWIGFSG